MQQFNKKSSSKKSYSQKAYLGRYPYNLVNSGNLTKYYQILTDYQFISAKINHPDFGIQALIEDYDLLGDTQTKTLKYIQSALRLSAHIVTQHKQQLPSQLWGRLQAIHTPEIQQLLQQISQTQTRPWLRPLTPSLTQAGGRLLRTLSGHSDWVNAVAVTADSKRLISGSRDKTVKVRNLETGEEIATFIGDADFHSCGVTPNDLTIVAGDRSGRLHFLKLENAGE
ncbi:WD40 repeat domain-containing protein [Anabaena sp. PCC 7108]|uniref:WD40 repeat domain-containing protein n=1 Tax=Anabaena sp. PCC 7108 TaxID=163908 RepID=UPI00034CE1E9|nr:hypothetical protein [Anabaena sp. PCC 7108]